MKLITVSDVKLEMEAIGSLIADAIEECSQSIVEAGNLIGIALADDRTIFFAGNGGSASQASHLAAEFVGRFRRERRPYPGISLTENVSSITAIANDFAYEEVFSRQVRALCKQGDVLVLLSTSGASTNVVQAASAARELGLIVVGLTGAGGGKLNGRTDVLIAVPGTDVAHVQEMHLVIGHILCSVAEANGGRE